MSATRLWVEFCSNGEAIVAPSTAGPLRATASLERTSSIRFVQGDELPIVGSESVPHRGEEFAQRRAGGNVALLIGVLDELFQDDLIFRREPVAPRIPAE